MEGLEEVSASVIIYSRSTCAQSLKAKLLLSHMGIHHLDICLDAFPQIEKQLMDLVGPNFQTPQIFFNNIRVPGYESLRRLTSNTELRQEMIEILQEDALQEDACPVAADGGEEDVIALCRKPSFLQNGAPFVHRLAPKGEDFVKWAIREKKMQRREALALGQRLIDRHFGVEGGGNNPDLVYQPQDNEDKQYAPLNTPAAARLLSAQSERRHDSVEKFNARLAEVLQEIYKEILTEDRQIIFYERLEQSEHFRRYRQLMPRLAELDLSDTTVQERLALFLNVHNIMLVHIVQRNGTHANIWQKKRFLNSTYYVVGQHRYSLQSIYNGILRGNRKGPGMLWKPFGKADPRRKWVIPNGEPLAHFGVIHYFAQGVPVRVFSVEGVYEELAENAHAFLGSPENLQLDGKVIRLSALFKTYADDFGMLPENVVDYVKNLLTEGSPERDFLVKALRPAASAESGPQIVINYLDFGLEPNFVRENSADRR